jgi:iron complex outermembrane receptor protein
MIVTPTSLHPLAQACVLACALAAAPVLAQTPTERVVITGSVKERSVADAPYAITVLDAETLRAAGPLVNLSEALVRVPGLVVNNRNNYAQDLQVSARGFGARAGFGVRGLRLYSDGIPATMPDGQGQVAHFDLAGADRVEVLRGPFSVLYGNSSGGVIAVFSNPARKYEAEAALDIGSFGLRQVRASMGTPLGDSATSGEGWDLRASAAALQIDGFRPHSEAKRRLANLRLGWRDADDRVVLQLGTFDQPADDPLGLRRADFLADPDQTAPEATLYDVRKTARQTQLGASWTHRFAGDGAGGGLRDSQLSVYTGQRSVAQWLAIAPGTQGNPRHGGGVIDFDRSYQGIEGRLRWGWEALDLVAGASIERQEDDRKGYENFTGTAPNQVLGTTGRLRRDETNSATTQDLFVQAELPLATSVTASAGVRAGRVKLDAEDAYLSNGDDSGALSFSYRNPVVGLRWQAAPGLQLHASAARGFESPTLGELAYRPDGVGGFNLGLKPQVSRQIELGAKWRAGPVELDAAVFRADVKDEIGVATNAGGRSSFQNVGRTERSGAELSLGWRISEAWRTQLVLNALDAKYVDGFLACAGIPCTAPSVPVAPGNQVAGTQRGSAWAEVAWRSASLGETALEWRAAKATAVNDTNSEFAPGYGSLSLRWTKRFAVGNGWAAETVVRVDNLGDQRYAGSVIVNDANGRYYEPSAPRSVLLALRLLYTR